MVTVSGTASGSFADKNVGTAKPVTVSGLTLSGADAGNYVLLAPASLNADITPASLTVTGLTANNKVYDATTAATLSGAATLGGVLAGDVVGVSGGTGNFADKNVGTGKPVTVSGIALSGADAGNYVVAAPTGLTANITPASLTITALNQSKLEGTPFTFNGTEFSAAGLVGGEQVSSVTLASTGAPSTATAGTYNINASSPVGVAGFLGSNYSIGFVTGSMLVSASPPPPDIAAADHRADAGTNASTDARSDASADAGTNASADTSTNASANAGTNASTNASARHRHRRQPQRRLRHRTDTGTNARTDTRANINNNGGQNRPAITAGRPARGSGGRGRTGLQRPEDVRDAADQGRRKAGREERSGEERGKEQRTRQPVPALSGV